MKLSTKNIVITKENDNKIYKFTKSSTTKDVKKHLLGLFQEEVDLVKDFDKSKKITVLVNIKEANFKTKLEAFKIAFHDENLVDPLFINNMMIFIKNSNTYTDEFFKDPNIFFNTKEEFIDLKSNLEKEITEFTTTICLYLVSLLKFYHRTLTVNLDTSKPMPLMYKAIFLSYDLMTIIMAFNRASSFETKKCIFFRDSSSVLNEMLSKFTVSYTMLESFLKTVPLNKPSLKDRIVSIFKRK